MHQVDVAVRPVAKLAPVIGPERFDRLVGAAGQFRARLADRTVWTVNSTAVGGGVAEMLQALVGYVADLGIDVRWAVIGGEADFFAVTKRLHNRLHGEPGDGEELDAAAAATYARTCAGNAEELAARVRPGDLVLLHDPQTAGLAEPLAKAGACVVWRCHVGIDEQNDLSRPAWEFLRPHLEPAHAYVFSRRSYAPPWLPDDRVWVIPPSIDPFATKNQPMSADTVHAVLARIGVLDAAVLDGAGAGGPRGAAGAGPRTFVRLDGTTGEVDRPASVLADALPSTVDPLVLQVSRWDRLKDMPGVMHGFAEHVAPATGGYLMLAGPAVAEVSDDPEGAAVYGECVAAWRALPAGVRRRIALVTLPLDDVDENAAMVNALQRQATVIVQKSLAEGFGLTVAEGMWKGRPAIGSAVGGIQDQIVDGAGILLPDPGDLAAFGAAVRDLLTHPDKAERMGAAAHARVAAEFLGDEHLLRYARLFGAITGGPPNRTG